MRNSTIRGLVVLGLIAIVGTISVQYYLLRTAFNEEDKEFNQTVHVALLEVVKGLYGEDVNKMPQINPVRRIDADYYVVNLNDHIEAAVLEYFLKVEFEKLNLTADFEYGIYDCMTDKMVYGNYISVKDKSLQELELGFLPKYKDLNYYFGVRFPEKKGYLLANMEIWIIFTLVLLFVLFFFTYAIFIVLRQKRFSELQQDFINNMTHEFKTPISSSKIALEYMLNEPLVNADQRLKKYCEMMYAQNDRLNSQVERILQISKTEKQNFSIERKQIDLVGLVKNIVDTFAIKRNDTSVSYKTELSELIVNADELHLTNVLYSIIDNSLKYCEREPIVNLLLKQAERGWLLTISDNGIGIEQKYLKKIFRKFYRVPTGDVHNVKGFGLGLFYVRKVCERHHWKIGVKSYPGQGTTISLLLPKV